MVEYHKTINFCVSTQFQTTFVVEEVAAIVKEVNLLAIFMLN